MTQILHVKRKDPATGRETKIELKVVRTWASPAGVLRLLADGSYVQADGSPPAEPGLLNVIADKHQRAAADEWWKRRGKQVSENYYRRRNEDLAARLAAKQGESTRLDARYYRIPVAGGDREGPFSWAESFAAAPEWWGLVDMTVVEKWVYVKEGVKLDLGAVVKAAGGAEGGVDEHGRARTDTDDGTDEAPGTAMDPLQPAVVTVFKRAAKQASKRFSGPYQQAMAAAVEWVAGKPAEEYGDARFEAVAIEAARIDPEVPVQSGPDEEI